MNTTQKRTLLILIGISLAYFLLFIPANMSGSSDPIMVSLFEPDEFAQYVFPINMMTVQPTIKATVYNFIAYGHYYYGYPFYLLSVLFLLPLKLSGGLNDHTQAMMLILRQFVSILPMMVAAILLVFIQTRFKSWVKSAILFLFLLTIPAVVQNNLWWHPDSLTVLFVVLTIFFLNEDRLSFGKYYWLAAFACGLAVGTKVLGLFFFLAILVYLIYGLVQRRITWKKALLKAAGFIVVMLVTVIVSNPYLLIPSERDQFIKIMTRQSFFMSNGWTLGYGKGPLLWADVVKNYYGSIPFLILVLALIVLAIKDKTSRLYTTLVLCWCIPLSYYVLFMIEVRPVHYLLPLALPLFTLLGYGLNHIDLPAHFLNLFKRENWLATALSILFCGISLFQFGSNIRTDIGLYTQDLYREQNNPTIAFFHTLNDKYLSPVPVNQKVTILRDVRMYFPSSREHRVSEYYNTLVYSKIEKNNPDVLLIWKQRVIDYTQSGAASKATDPEAFKEINRFFTDAANHQIAGYQLLYENDYGMAFVSDGFNAQFHVIENSHP
jgi:hypothetical protein